MQVQIRHSPSFALARLSLTGGEIARVESGAMAMHSAGLELEAKMEGGLMKSLKRSVMGGESLFVSKYTAPATGGWVDVAAKLPGDAFTVEVNGTYILTRGSFLACSADLEIDTKWGGFSKLAGGEGGFLIHVTGTGTLVGSCYGALDRHQLEAGQAITVDSGHLVSYTEGIQITSRKAASGGLIQSVKSGESLVFDVTGPGEVITQSRNPHEFLGWLIPQLPSRA
ncbi:MAG: hypothetical protein QOF76_5457 [Solirubrobacteraceae bacterium]|jgi:uncharacterized protein (TIGR00266 family)|nr:hypothetical protein [Solirubrobacteraceae bacterium]